MIAIPTLILLACILCPVLFAIIVVIFPSLSQKRSPILYIAPLVSFVACLQLFFYDKFQFTLLKLGTFGFNIEFFVHNKGLLFAGMTSFLWAITNLYSTGYMKLRSDLHMFFFYLSISMFCVLCISFSHDMIFTFIMYELLSIFTYKLVVCGNTSESFEAGAFYIITLVTASVLLLLPSILILHSINCPLKIGNICSLTPENHIAFSIAFWCMVYGLAKMALMPIHKWLVKAMVAPAPVSAFLHAVAVVKSGVFIFIIFTTGIFGVNNLKHFLLPGDHFNLLTYIAGASVIISSLMALREKQIKKLLAYSTISNLSYMVLSVSTFTSASANAAFFYMISHSFAKISLFFFAGIIQRIYFITNINEMYGLVKKMPIASICAIIAVFGIIGLPPTSGFWGKFYILTSAIHGQNADIVLIMCISTLLNTMYFVPMLITMFSSTKENVQELPKQIPVAMLLPTVIASVVTIIIFIYPQILLRIIAQP